jgi:hypothetical protein
MDLPAPLGRDHRAPLDPEVERHRPATGEEAAGRTSPRPGLAGDDPLTSGPLVGLGPDLHWAASAVIDASFGWIIDGATTLEVLRARSPGV